MPPQQEEPASIYLRRLDDARYERLEQRLTTLETKLRDHAEDDKRLHDKMMAIVEIKDSATLGARAVMWLAGLGAAVSAIWGIFHWKG